MDLVEPLFDAVAQGEEQLVLMYLQLGGNISARGVDGQNALHWAAASPFGEQLLTFLLGKGADINAEDDMGYTPLHIHALRGRVYGTSCLLQAGADANIASPKNDFTPLHLAILHNHIEVANILLAYGADYRLLDNLRDVSVQVTTPGPAPSSYSPQDDTPEPSNAGQVTPVPLSQGRNDDEADDAADLGLCLDDGDTPLRDNSATPPRQAVISSEPIRAVNLDDELAAASASSEAEPVEDSTQSLNAVEDQLLTSSGTLEDARDEENSNLEVPLSDPVSE